MADGLSGVMNLAAAAGTDLGVTSDIVTDSIENFGLTAKDAEHYVNVVAQTMRKSNTDVIKLGESFKYVSPVAKAMGYSLEDTNVALGLMANSGIKASQAGTSLRTLLTNMAKPTDTMAAAMETLGVSLDDGHGNMKSFYEVMLDLREGFGELKMPQEEFQKQMLKLNEGLNDGSIKSGEYDEAVRNLTERAYGAEGALKAQAAASLAGKEGMSGLLAIVNASDETFYSLVNDINQADGALTGMKNSIDGLAQPTVEQAAAMAKMGVSALDSEGNLRSYSKILGDLKNSFGEMQMPIDEYNKKLSKLQDAYSMGKMSQEDFSKNLKILMTNAYGAEGAVKAQAAATLLGKDNMGQFAESLGMTTEEFLGFTQEVENSKGAAEEMAGVMNDNLKGQITILKSALEDLSIEIYTHFQESGTEMAKIGQQYINQINAGLQENGAQGMFDAFGNILSDVLGRIIEFLPTMTEYAIQLIGMLGTALIENAPLMLAALQEMLVIVLGAIGEAVPILQPVTDAIAAFITNLEEFVPYLEGAAVAVGIFVGALGAMQIISQVVAWANTLKTALTGLFTVLAANPIMIVVGLIGLLVGAFVTLWNKSEEFRNFWKELWNKIKTIAEPVINGIKDAMQNAWKGIKNTWDKVQPYFEEIWNGIKTVWDVVQPYFETMFNAINDIVTTVWNGIKQIIGNAWTHIKNIWDKAKPFFTKLFNAIKEVVTTVWTIVSDIIKKAWETIKPVWEKAKPFFDAIWEGIKAAVEVVKTVLVGVFEQAWNAIETVWSVVTTFFGGIFDAIKGIFATIEALWKGDFQGAKKAIVGVFTGIKDTFFKIAGNIIDGLINGIKGGVDTVVNAVKGVADGIINGFKSLLGIASPSKVFRKFGNYILDGLNKGIDDKSKKTIEKMKKLSKDVAEQTLEVYKEMNKELKKVNKDHEKNLAQIEKDYKSHLKTLKDDYLKETGEIDTEHLEKLADINKSYSDALYQSAKDRTDALNKLEKDNREALLKIEQDYNSTTAQLAETRDASIKQAEADNAAALLKIEEDYKNTLANIQKQQDEFASKIVNFAGLLNAPAEENVISNEEVVENAKAQTLKVQKYADALNRLKTMNLPEEILQQFIEMGAGSAEQLEEFSKMTSAQLQEFLTAYNERKALADKVAADNFSSARAEADRQFNEQKAQQEKNFDAVLIEINKEFDAAMLEADRQFREQKNQQEKEYKAQLFFIEAQYLLQKRKADREYSALKKEEQKRYSESLKQAKANYKAQKQQAIADYNDLIETENRTFNKSMKKLSKLCEKRMEKVGNNIKKGLKQGATMSRWEIIELAGQLTDGLIQQVEANLGIASPSKVFAKIGDYCIQGFEQPFKDYQATEIMSTAINGQLKFDTSAIDRMLNLNNAGQKLNELRAATLSPITYDNREEINNNPVLNFYDTQTSPDAIYRKFNKTMRYGLARGV